MAEGRTVAIVGATGLVGTAMRDILVERNFPLAGPPRMLASARSAGSTLRWGNDDIAVEELTADSFDGIDIALFSAGAERSRTFAPAAVASGAVVIDNSSAFRMESDVPLVVADVNDADIKDRPRGIVANPNCTTMILLMAVAPLHRAWGLEHMVVTTYQAAGGAGQQGINELLAGATVLLENTNALVSGTQEVFDTLPVNVFGKPIPFNVVPLCGDVDDDGYSVEERKLVNESRKILHHPTLQVAPTCVRVGVAIGHAMQTQLRFSQAGQVDEAIELLRASAGVVVADGANGAPTSLEATGIDDALVGRVRRDLDDDRVLHLFVTGDNLRKGAALNTVQLAELVAQDLG